MSRSGMSMIPLSGIKAAPWVLQSGLPCNFQPPYDYAVCYRPLSCHVRIRYAHDRLILKSTIQLRLVKCHVVFDEGADEVVAVVITRMSAQGQWLLRNATRGFKCMGQQLFQ